MGLCCKALLGWMAFRYLVVALLFAAAGAVALGSARADPGEDDVSLYHSPADRLGFGFVQWPPVLVGFDDRGRPIFESASDDIADYDVAQLKAGWYVNWGSIRPNLNIAGLDFVPIIRLCDPAERPDDCSSPHYRPSGSQLDRLVEAYPGRLWLVGNEPDAPLQDAIRPNTYVELYHEVYYRIKGVDPTARVAIGGIVQVSDVRMRWLNKVWEGYQQRYGVEMPVDVWNIHTFILREVRRDKGAECQPPGATDESWWGAQIPPGVDANCGWWIDIWELDRLDLVQEQVVRFRQWMRDHGQREKELIISEYGIFFPEAIYRYNHPRVRDFMLATFDYFMAARDEELGMPADGNRLVQRWAWYSLNDLYTFDSQHVVRGAMFHPDTKEIQPLGEDFANYATSVFVPFYDLELAELTWEVEEELVYGQPARFDMRAKVRNWGNAEALSVVLRWLRRSLSGSTEVLAEENLPTIPLRWGGSVDGALNWETTIDGPIHIIAQLEAGDDVLVVDSHNDSADFLIDVNLQVSSIESLDGIPEAFFGETVPITVRAQIKNTGDVIIPSHQVGFWRGHPDTGELLETVEVQDFVPGQTRTLDVLLNLEIGYYPIYVYADFNNAINESSVDDNIKKLDLSVVASCYAFGSLGVGVVDIADVQAVAHHWRQRPGDDGWNPWYDVTGNQTVTVEDVLRVGAELGQPCVQPEMASRAELNCGWCTRAGVDNATQPSL